MNDKKRICGTCAWWDQPDYERLANGYGICCFENKDNAKNENSFCRHHSFTRGWSEDAKNPLIEWSMPLGTPGDKKHEHLSAETPDELELIEQINKAWEVYRKLVSDWYLMKDK